MENRSIKDAMLRAVNHHVKELARYRRMVEVAPDVHEMTVEEYDALLNKKCDEATTKFSKMDLGEMLLDGLMNAISNDVAVNGPDVAGERFSKLFKGMGDE